jgi:hypothetical protein
VTKRKAKPVVEKPPGELARYKCNDCDVNVVTAGEFYMLYPDIWEDQLGLDWNDNLCIGCLEARIGRPVTFADIISIPNYSWMQPSSDRLLDRLGFKKCNGKWRHKSEKPKRRKSRGIVASLTATKAGKVKLRHTFV